MSTRIQGLGETWLSLSTGPDRKTPDGVVYRIDVQNDSVLLDEVGFHQLCDVVASLIIDDDDDDDEKIRWEYKNIERRSLSVETLDPLGDDGWELCAVVENLIIFKRQRRG